MGVIPTCRNTTEKTGCKKNLFGGQETGEVEFSSSRCSLAAESGFGAARTKIRGRNRALPIKTSGTGGMDGSHPIKKPTSLRQGESVGGGVKTFFFSRYRHRGIACRRHISGRPPTLFMRESLLNRESKEGGGCKSFFFSCALRTSKFRPFERRRRGPRSQDSSAFPFPPFVLEFIFNSFVPPCFRLSNSFGCNCLTLFFCAALERFFFLQAKQVSR